MNPILQILITSIILGLFIGIPIGWCIRSLFIARQIERVARETWKQARIIQNHNGTL